MEPYISEKEADSIFSIMTQVDPSGGRWDTTCLHDICAIVRKCLEDNRMKRATIKDVRSNY